MDATVTRPLRRIDLATEVPFRVGLAIIDPASRDATFAASTERLQPQNLKVLIALCRHKGGVVTREDLVDLCWDGRIVGEDVINKAISMLRQFADRAGGFEIETVPRSGYRLIEMGDAPARRRYWWLAMAAGAAVLFTAAAWLFLDGQSQAPKSDVPTVAVLPFVGEAGNRNIRDLATATGASLRYALADAGYPVALVDKPASSAQPDLLVSGNVQHSGSSVQVFVEVEETSHGVIVYSHRFEANGDSATTLPDQIGASVATNLSRAATLIRLDRRHPSDPTIAAQLLNSESHALDNGDGLRAFEVARQLAPKAPNSAIAQFGLATETANAFYLLPRDQRAAAIAAGRVAADRVLAIAPDFGDAYGLQCALRNPIYLRQCEDEVRRGVAVDPDAPSAMSDLGTLLNSVGREDEALELDQISLAKDPLNPFKLGRMIRLLEETGRTARAEQLFRQAIRWWPDHPTIYWSRVVGIESRGDYGALERLEGEVEGEKLPLDREAAAAVIAGVRSHDRSGVAHSCAAAGLRWTTQFLCVTALAQLGDLDQSYAIADRLFPSVHGRTPAEDENMWLDDPGAFSIAVLSSPAAAALRRDPRFLVLADGSGLLDYWRSGRLPDFCRQKPEPVCGAILGRPMTLSVNGRGLQHRSG